MDCPGQRVAHLQIVGGRGAICLRRHRCAGCRVGCCGGAVAVGDGVVEQIDGGSTRHQDQFTAVQQAKVGEGREGFGGFSGSCGLGRRRTAAVAQAIDHIFALRRAAPGRRDEFAQVAPGMLVPCQGDQPKAVLDLLEPELAAHDQANAEPAGPLVRAHHAGHRTFVRDRKRCIAERVRALDQLFGKRCAAVEAEARQRMEFDIARLHAYNPCRNQQPSDNAAVPRAAVPARRSRSR